jgi:BTB/POZ domain
MYTICISTFQIFRCHKVFLASSSEAFEKMLFGAFKEGSVDRDYEICITKTSPVIFDLAMRYS